MWARAAGALARYPEAVLNAIDEQGYPLSVRQTSPRYDATTGLLPVVIPDSLGAVEGPASLLAHHHDDKLWNLHAVLIKGRLQRRDDGWVFVSVSFTPPSTWAMLRGAKQACERYLASRKLPRPVVRFESIQAMWAEAKKIQNP